MGLWAAIQSKPQGAGEVASRLGDTLRRLLAVSGDGDAFPWATWSSGEDRWVFTSKAPMLAMPTSLQSVAAI